MTPLPPIVPAGPADAVPGEPGEPTVEGAADIFAGLLALAAGEATPAEGGHEAGDDSEHTMPLDTPDFPVAAESPPFPSIQASRTLGASGTRAAEGPGATAEPTGTDGNSAAPPTPVDADAIPGRPVADDGAAAVRTTNTAVGGAGTTTRETDAPVPVAASSLPPGGAGDGRPAMAPHAPVWNRDRQGAAPAARNPSETLPDGRGSDPVDAPGELGAAGTDPERTRTPVPVAGSSRPIRVAGKVGHVSSSPSTNRARQGAAPPARGPREPLPDGRGSSGAPSRPAGFVGAEEPAGPIEPAAARSLALAAGGGESTAEPPRVAPTVAPVADVGGVAPGARETASGRSTPETPAAPADPPRAVLDGVRVAAELRRPVRVRLDPPELGTVRVELASSPTEPDAVRVRLAAAEPAGRAALAEALPRLREHLAAAGVRVEAVELEPAARDEPAGDRHARDRERPGGSGAGGFGSHAGGERRGGGRFARHGFRPGRGGSAGGTGGTGGGAPAPADALPTRRRGVGLDVAA